MPLPSLPWATLLHWSALVLQERTLVLNRPQRPYGLVPTRSSSRFILEC